jgi:oligoribonuclease
MAKHLLWLDMEMTGLDESKDQILEVALRVTDWKLQSVDHAEWVVYQPQEVLENMNAWCKENHGKSGLTGAIPAGKPLADVEAEMVAFVGKYFGQKQGKEGAVLAGNSIHNDRRFIDRYLPKFASTLHYRMVDVSSFKEVFRERFAVKYEKKNAHRALDDLNESIAELEHYLSLVNLTK